MVIKSLIKKNKTKKETSQLHEGLLKLPLVLRFRGNEVSPNSSYFSAHQLKLKSDKTLIHPILLLQPTVCGIIMDRSETLPYPSPTSYNARINSGRIRPRRSVLSRFVAGLFSAVMTCFFATIGSIVGAVTGGLIGLATESGLLRGAGIGAISGAVFCIEAVESSIALRQTSNRSGIRSLVFVVDIVLSLLSGRLVREKVGPAVQSAVQSQMRAMEVTETTSSMDVFDIFETGTKFQGMARESVEKIPKILITSEDNTCCCSVCLQDFQVGESVRSLPQCNHMFHLPCIDGWLIAHGSCPLCRRDF